AQGQPAARALDLHGPLRRCAQAWRGRRQGQLPRTRPCGGGGTGMIDAIAARLTATLAAAPPALWWVMGGLFAVLLLASAIGAWMARGGRGGSVVDNLIARIRAWWGMVAVLCVCFLIGPVATMVVFAITSFFALREFVTLTPTRRGDHLALCLCFYVAIP